MHSFYPFFPYPYYWVDKLSWYTNSIVMHIMTIVNEKPTTVDTDLSDETAMKKYIKSCTDYLFTRSAIITLLPSSFFLMETNLTIQSNILFLIAGICASGIFTYQLKSMCSDLYSISYVSNIYKRKIHQQQLINALEYNKSWQNVSGIMHNDLAANLIVRMNNSKISWHICKQVNNNMIQYIVYNEYYSGLYFLFDNESMANVCMGFVKFLSVEEVDQLYGNPTRCNVLHNRIMQYQLKKMIKI